MTAPAPIVPAGETDTAVVLRPGPATLPVPVAVDRQVAVAPGVGAGTRPADRASDDRAAARVLTPTSAEPVPGAVEVDRALPVDAALAAEVLAAAADAVVASSRYPLVAARADWGRTGLFDHPLSDLTPVLEELTVLREVGGSLPAEVGIVDGASAATASLTLSGRWDDPDDTAVVEALAPYNPDGPFYRRRLDGVPVELSTGFRTRVGPAWFPLLEGAIARYVPAASTRDVKVDLLDPASYVRAPITLGAGGLDGVILRRYGTRYVTRINSQWLVDHIFRRNGVYASPPIRDDAFIAATMHGSTIPERGTGGVPVGVAAANPLTDEPWTNAGHPFGMLYPAPTAPTPLTFWYTDGVAVPAGGNGFGLSCWMLLRPSDPERQLLRLSFINANPAMSIGTLAGGLPCASIDEGVNGGRYAFFGGTAPTAATWVFFGIHVRFDNDRYYVTGRYGGTTFTGSRPYDPSGQTWGIRRVVTLLAGAVMTNVQAWSAPTAPAGPWVGETWTPQAQIDPGAASWFGIPAITGEESWALLTEIAAAELATVLYNPVTRMFRYRTLAGARDRGPRPVLTTDDTIADLNLAVDEAGIRDSVTAAAQPYLIGDWEWIYESASTDELDAGPGTTTFRLTPTPGTCIVWTSQAVTYCDGTTYAQYVSRYDRRNQIIAAVVRADDPTVLLDFDTINTEIVFTVYQISDTEIVLVVVNRLSYSVRFATPDTIDTTTGARTVGQPALKIPGRVLAAGPATTVTATDGTPADTTRAYTLPASRWRQDPTAVSTVCYAVVAQTAQATAVLDRIRVPHDPRRDVLDPVRIVDRTGQGQIDGTIMAITTIGRPREALIDELTVRPVGPPGLGILGDPDLGRVGETLYLGA